MLNRRQCIGSQPAKRRMDSQQRDELAVLRLKKGSTTAPGIELFTIEHPDSLAVIETNSRDVVTDGPAQFRA